VAAILSAPALSNLPRVVQSITEHHEVAISHIKIQNSLVIEPSMLEAGNVDIVAAKRALLNRVTQKWSKYPASQRLDCAALVKLASPMEIHPANKHFRFENIVDEEVIVHLLQNSQQSGFNLSPFDETFSSLIGIILERWSDPERFRNNESADHFRRSAAVYALRWCLPTSEITQSSSVREDLWGAELCKVLAASASIATDKMVSLFF
jgi:hypothetical protein